MRSTFAIIAIVFVLAAIVCAADEKPVSPDTLRAMAEAANGEPCTHICLDAARALAEQANQLFTDGNVEKAQAAMKDSVRFALKAAQASVQTHKKQKQTEIGLRKLEKRILDIKETLAFEDKPPLQEGADAIDKARASILASMFDLHDPKEEKK